jgi:hypothetical protein
MVLVAFAPFLACSSDDSPSPATAASDGGATDSGAGPDTGGGTDGSTSADANGANDSGVDAGPLPGFVVETPQISIGAGEDIIKCFYLHLPNTTDVAVKTWKSTKTPGVGHASLHLTATDLKTPGTVSADGCAMSNSWVYSAYEAQDGWSFPADDGAGKPVAKTVTAAKPGYILMHLTNPTGAPIMAKVTIEGIGYPSGTATTAAEPYLAFDTDIDIAPSSTGEIESSSCDVPAGSKLAWLSTHARKLSTQTKVSTGGTAIFTGTNWEDPGSLVGAAPFKTFTNDKVDVECKYDNSTSSTVAAGDTVADEACTMLAYVFPATKTRFCVNGTLIP